MIPSVTKMDVIANGREMSRSKQQQEVSPGEDPGRSRWGACQTDMKRKQRRSEREVYPKKGGGGILKKMCWTEACASQLSERCFCFKAFKTVTELKVIFLQLKKRNKYPLFSWFVVKFRVKIFFVFYIRFRKNIYKCGIRTNNLLNLAKS